MQSIKPIKEIFEGKEDLLEFPEVQEVLTQLRIQWKGVCEKRIQSRDKISKIESIVFNSEFFVVNGVSYQDTIEKIIKLLED